MPKTIPALIRKVVERWDPIEVWGTGDDIRDVIYVEDVVEAMMLAMEKIESYTVVNIGFGTGYSVKQILHTILNLTDIQKLRLRLILQNRA